MRAVFSQSREYLPTEAAAAVTFLSNLIYNIYNFTIIFNVSK